MLFAYEALSSVLVKFSWLIPVIFEVILSNRCYYAKSGGSLEEPGDEWVAEGSVETCKIEEIIWNECYCHYEIGGL